MKKLIMIFALIALTAVTFGQKLRYTYVLPLPNTTTTVRLDIGDPIYIQSTKQFLHAKAVLPSGYTIPTSWLAEYPPIQQAVVTIDTISVRVMGDTAYTLVAAPGTGKLIEILDVIVSIGTVTGTIEIGTQTMDVYHETSSAPVYTFTNASVETATSVVLAGIRPTTQPVVIANKAIKVAYSGTDNATGGAKATMKFFVTYKVITL